VFLTFFLLLISVVCTLASREHHTRSQQNKLQEDPSSSSSSSSSTGVPSPLCHPMCRWQCDDPDCPAVCKPTCRPPQCEVQCDQGACAECEIRCQEPECIVRCPKDVCEKDNCPPCQTVCAPAKCRTICTPPKARCTPVCSPTECHLTCDKPADCPKPKCQLLCSKVNCSVGQMPWNEAAESKCCPCTPATLKTAMIVANEQINPEKEVLTEADELKENPHDMMPSFLEIMHTIQHYSQLGNNDMCCPCSSQPISEIPAVIVAKTKKATH